MTGQINTAGFQCLKFMCYFYVIVKIKKIDFDLTLTWILTWTLAWIWHGLSQWRHNERSSVSNHQRLHCLLKCRFRRRTKKTSNLRVTGLCAGNSPVTGEFPAQKALKRKCCHFDEILITDCTESCHFDNFRCSQWWKFHQNDDISVSVKPVTRKMFPFDDVIMLDFDFEVLRYLTRFHRPQFRNDVWFLNPSSKFSIPREEHWKEIYLILWSRHCRGLLMDVVAPLIIICLHVGSITVNIGTCLMWMSPRQPLLELSSRCLILNSTTRLRIG